MRGNTIFCKNQSMETQSICGENEDRIWLESVINKNANNKSISRIIDLNMKQAIPEGDNYASIIYRAKFTAILRNGSKSKLSVIMKKAHENKEKLEAISEIQAFKIEIKVYKDVLRKLEFLMNEHEDYSGTLWCNLIACRPFDLMVLEDLKLQSFSVADRKKMLDLNHSKLVLHSLGSFHALGFVLLQKGLLYKEDFPSFYCDIESTIIQRLFQAGLIVLSRAIEKYWTSEWKEIGRRIYNEHKVVMEKLKKLFAPQENSFTTMCHGDCWTCNMMFKYSPYDKDYPVAMKFLDFQTTHINPYIFDVMHFLYTSVHPEIRRANYDQLLSLYHKSLKSTLTMYGFEERTPTLENVHAEAERIEYYSFTSSVIISPVTTAQVKDAFKIEYLNFENKWKEAFNEDIFNSELYKLTVQTELRKWFNKGLF